MEAAIVTIAAKLVSNTFGLIGRYILRPVARRVCPLKNLWKYKSNLENLKTELQKLVDTRERLQGLTNAGVEHLPAVNDWLRRATTIINELSPLNSENNPERGCCEGCTYSNLKECYQHRNNVAHKLMDVAQLLEEAMNSISLWEHKSNVENLNIKVKNLEAKRKSVYLLINAGKEPLPHVKVWLDKVKKTSDGVSGLTGEHIPEQQNKVAQMLKDVDQLLQEEAQFREVSYQPDPEPPHLQPCIQQEFFESRTSILNDIIAALRKADVNMVGIYGMGGVGKTFLSKEVGDQAIEEKLFDKVVFVQVFQSPEIDKIQGAIADRLGLKLTKESVPGRAEQLCGVLKKEKKILIILDNLWEAITLQEVGIPFGNDCTGLKLLLTGRSHDVLAKQMDSQPNFYVGALIEAEAWILFKRNAGTCVDKPHLKTIANEVAKKCGGLPLAIVTVAKALKNTEAEEAWTEALRKLNEPSPVGFGKVYNSIKLSYDHLDEQLQKIFLLCSRMGRTYDASIHDLLRYGLGLGYFDNIVTVEGALCNVSTSVDQLKAASLLLHAPPETNEFSSWGRFAIHDVVCDVARLIASIDQHVFTVTDGRVPPSWTNEKTLENCTSITLYTIGELSKDLELACPNIKFLYVKAKEKYPKLTVPDNFFRGMLSLQVLHLIEFDLKSLPSSLSCLVDLRALCLDYCYLKDVAAIGDRSKLAVLSFRGCLISMLPKEMCQLTKLRLLDLSHCSFLSVIPSKVMSSLTGIEALYTNNTSIGWEDASPSIDELKHLRRLTTLEISIPEPKMFRGLISSEPARYKISIGSFACGWGVTKPYSNKSRRFFRLQLDTKEDWIISQLPRVEELELKGDVVGAMNLLDELDRNGFPQLMHLDVSYNNHCVCIVNSVSGAVLPSLESLMVNRMGSLEKICNSPLGEDSFLNLKTIHVEECNKLSNIFFFFSIVRDLPNLIDLEVSRCENMEEIFAIEEQDDGNSTEVVHDIKFSQLSRLRLSYLPKLKSFCCKAKSAPPLQLASDTSASQIFSAKELNNHSSLFNEKVATPNLQNLQVFGVQRIEQIWHNLPQILFSCVQNLTRLSVCRCFDLKELFSSSTTISEESREKERRDTIVFPKLNDLYMDYLTDLTRLCSGYNVEFRSLKVFNIGYCSQLMASVFDEMVVTPNLQDLRVESNDQIERIWHSLFPTLSSCIQNLTKLSVCQCDNLKELFSSSTTISEESREKERRDTIVFPQLNHLRMENLTNLTRLCSGYNVEFPLLKVFEMRSCPQLKTSVFDETVKVLSLEELSIFEMDNLEMIWHNNLTEDSFPKLKSLIVSCCPKLLTMFPSSMRGRLLSLESLNVDDCSSLVQICDIQGINSEVYEHVPFMNLQELKVLAKEGVIAKDVPAKFVFPKLTSLKLNCLPKLRTFCPGKHTVEGPILKKLALCDWGICHTDEEGQMLHCLLHLVQQLVFPCLEELKLTGKQLTMMGQVQVPECLVHKLKILDVQEYESTVFPPGIIQRCQNLEKLLVTGPKFFKGGDQTQAGSYKEILFCGEDQTQAASLARVKTLVLRDLRDMKYIWEQYSIWDLIFQNLEVLTIDGCNSLVNLMPPSASFQNLTILNVRSCNSLETIVTSSMAKSLMKLEKMCISRCPKITEVIQNHGEVTEKIIFSNLKTLELMAAHELTSFCPCNFTLEFPSLEKLEVCCRNMKTFSRGDLTMPRLKEVKFQFKYLGLCPDTNLNTIIQQFHAERVEDSCSD